MVAVLAGLTQARASRSMTLPAGQGHVTDIFIQRGSCTSLGIGLPLRASSLWVFGICRVAPLNVEWPTSELRQISIG